MSCPEFENSGYLFLSGELTPSKRIAFKKHLEQCPACREALEGLKEIWGLMEQLPQVSPSSEIRDAVLKNARRRVAEPSFWSRLLFWKEQWTLHRGLAWGLSTAVVALFLLVVFFRPFDRIRTDQKTIEEVLVWDDGFTAEVDWMNQEIDRVESGSLLMNYVFIEDKVTDPDDWLSPMSDDINWIREKVEDLIKTIYGI